jgi:hypothetical protein
VGLRSRHLVRMDDGTDSVKNMNINEIKRMYNQDDEDGEDSDYNQDDIDMVAKLVKHFGADETVRMMDEKTGLYKVVQEKTGLYKELQNFVVYYHQVTSQARAKAEGSFSETDTKDEDAEDSDSDSNYSELDDEEDGEDPNYSELDDEEKTQL